MPDRLALHGGPPVWTGGWPPWPATGPATGERVGAALASGRWTVSGFSTGRPPLDEQLAERFATFTGARWCVPVDHGSNALLASLAALDIGPGDEVVVPGLTWVACGSAVARAGAVPVLVDIDPATLCMDPAAVEAAITERTAAVLVVHLYSAMADMDALTALAERHGLAVVEDASQAYGATWRGRGAGSLGTTGTFSAQQGKALTSGEGGLVVTSDERLRRRLEMLRGDGRAYAPGERTVGRPDLEEHAEVQGWNMHLSEVQAALLLDGLDRLPEQNRRRAAFAAWLDRELTAAGDLEAIVPYPANDGRAYYHYAVRLLPGAFAGCPVETVCAALSAELGTWVHPTYRPLDEHPLYDPRRLPLARAAPGLREALDPGRFDLPHCHREADRTILLSHPVLLGGDRHREAVAEAFAKVRAGAATLRSPQDS